jgi:hypothetical protein
LPANFQSNAVFGFNSAPGDDPFAPKQQAPPTHQDFTNRVLNAYVPQAPGSVPHQTPNGQFQPAPNGTAPVLWTMNDSPPEEQEPQNEVDKALKKLVNVERINEPAEYGRKLTMMKEEEKRKKTIKGKSVPIPPVASGMIGSNATLSHISIVKGVS